MAYAAAHLFLPRFSCSYSCERQLRQVQAPGPGVTNQTPGKVKGNLKIKNYNVQLFPFTGCSSSSSNHVLSLHLLFIFLDVPGPCLAEVSPHFSLISGLRVVYYPSTEYSTSSSVWKGRVSITKEKHWASSCKNTNKFLSEGIGKSP